ncbi:NUDIX domain protein [Tothia fuscella]|uniref:NUDIX domain protein n=1 Tax=Tothia fuscella TaxID=1048955 RepID=A0A9P4P4E5_9PEZI|nr:NUDIX domain protein [Tothia fuscella]
MANLKPVHAAAIARLRTYVPPPTQYYSLPLTRRAAVLILLYADRQGELRVVLTMRARTLRTYGGQAALPGGKADSLSETPFQTARREAQEEIGLPLLDSKFPPPFRIEHLCQMPTNLARTELGVRPCVAYLSPHPNFPADRPYPTAEEALIPRLDAKEVAAVFSAPFHSFLKEHLGHESVAAEGYGVETVGQRPEWYSGTWTDWHESRWRMHNFFVPLKGQTVAWAPTTKTSPAVGSSSLPYRDVPAAEGASKKAQDEMKTFRVFGMTARILVDAARVAYGEEPEFEHNSHFGDEDMIGRLFRLGKLGGIRREGDELTREDLIAASKI